MQFPICAKKTDYRFEEIQRKHKFASLTDLPLCAEIFDVLQE
jgi:hypothetical protein